MAFPLVRRAAFLLPFVLQPWAPPRAQAARVGDVGVIVAQAGPVYQQRVSISKEDVATLTQQPIPVTTEVIVSDRMSFLELSQMSADLGEAVRLWSERVEQLSASEALFQKLVTDAGTVYTLMVTNEGHVRLLHNVCHALAATQAAQGLEQSYLARYLDETLPPHHDDEHHGAGENEEERSRLAELVTSLEVQNSNQIRAAEAEAHASRSQPRVQTEVLHSALVKGISDAAGIRTKLDKAQQTIGRLLDNFQGKPIEAVLMRVIVTNPNDTRLCLFDSFDMRVDQVTLVAEYMGIGLMWCIDPHDVDEHDVEVRQAANPSVNLRDAFHTERGWSLAELGELSWLATLSTNRGVLPAIIGFRPWRTKPPDKAALSILQSAEAEFESMRLTREANQ